MRRRKSGDSLRSVLTGHARVKSAYHGTAANPITTSRVGGCKVICISICGYVNHVAKAAWSTLVVALTSYFHKKGG